MEYKKLKVRPRSTTEWRVFGGWWNYDEAPLQSTKDNTMRWKEERNLSHDKYPMLSVAKGPGSVTSIDGNWITRPIIAMCGGDHLVILDAYGDIHCNGHSLSIGTDTYQWSTDVDSGTSNAEVYPSSGYTDDNTMLGGLVVLNTDVKIKGEYDPDVPAQGYARWYCDNGIPDDWTEIDVVSYSTGQGQYTGWGVWTFADLGNINVKSEDIQRDDVVVTFHFSTTHNFDSSKVVMTRMGANVLIWPLKKYVNAVKLAAGQTLVEGTDYGDLEALKAIRAVDASLKLCREDGTLYSGIVVSATEPAQDGLWLDTSDSENPVLKEWTVSISSWVVIESTYVLLGPFFGGGTGNGMGSIRKGDAVQMTADFLSSSEPECVKQLLNSSHYVYNVITNNGDDFIVVAGMLPSDEYLLNYVGMSNYVEIARNVPEMDFVVEAQNRLWGCRYDEANSINEIYASKLGDPRNWQVFQGLSTDSWTASRGTPAPFTGAAVLDGKPLFFREESLEKVYPSSTGAHQIQTFDLEGVQQGSHNSLVVIDDRLYYKSRQSVMVYAGTMPRRISYAFGDSLFSDASAARYGKRYVVSMKENTAPFSRFSFVYDINTGEWHKETNAWAANQKAITWKDDLYYIDANNSLKKYAGGTTQNVEWRARTGLIGYELPEHRFISCIRIRYSRQIFTSAKVYIKYDNDYTPKLKAELERHDVQTSGEINLYPRRCDNFFIYIEGTGAFEMISLSYRTERSEGGH